MQTMESTTLSSIAIHPSGTDGQKKNSSATATVDAQSPSLKESLVMMVDDEPINTEVVQAYLEEFGFRRFITCSDSSKAMSLLVLEQPDVLLLDLMMPKVSGFDVLAAMKADTNLRHIPVVMLTSSTDAETKLKALKMGANDFLGKPVDPSELALRLINTLTAKAYQDHLAEYSSMLEQQVRLRTAELEAAQQQLLHCLAAAGEFRNQETGMHVVRVGRYAGILAKRLGASEQWSEMIELAAPLHDVGKIGISDSILLKPGRLEPSEIEAMQEHCVIGTKIIRPTSLRECFARGGNNMVDTHESPIMQMAFVIAKTHHEKWDGSGYPQGLKGEEIPLEGRIVAVADVYDALSTERPYKEAFPREVCFAFIQEGRGTHFDPQIVDAFFAGLDEMQAVRAELPD